MMCLIANLFNLLYIIYGDARHFCVSPWLLCVNLSTDFSFYLSYLSVMSNTSRLEFFCYRVEKSCLNDSHNTFTSGAEEHH